LFTLQSPKVVDRLLEVHLSERWFATPMQAMFGNLPAALGKIGKWSPEQAKIQEDSKGPHFRAALCLWRG
jgi:hypothetical protein